MHPKNIGSFSELVKGDPELTVMVVDSARFIGAEYNKISPCGGWLSGRDQFCDLVWNPLEDDGDASRLLIKLMEKSYFFSIQQDAISNSIHARCIFIGGEEGREVRVDKKFEIGDSVGKTFRTAVVFVVSEIQRRAFPKMSEECDQLDEQVLAERLRIFSKELKNNE